MTQVLFLSADPSNIKPLPTGPELRDATEALNSAGITTAICPAMRRDDLYNRMLRDKPTILHFSGHGEQTKGIVIHADDHVEHGRVARADSRLDGRALKAFLKAFNHHLRLVFLNACYSSEQADAIAEVVECVVVVDGPVGNNAATTLASKFYKALASGASVGAAIKAAKAFFDLTGGLDAGPFRLVPGANTDPHDLYPFDLEEANRRPAKPTGKPLPRQTVAITPWHPIEPAKLGVAAPKLSIDIAPPDVRAWHTAHEPGSDEWREAWRKLNAGLERMALLEGAVDVFASLGYAPAVAAGAMISNMRLAPAFWQLTGTKGGRQWTRYGTATDHDDKVLYDLDAQPHRSSQPVALMVGITHDLEFRAVAHGLHAAGIESQHARLITFGPLNGPGYQSIKDAKAAQQAANDLIDRLYRLQVESPHAEVHLFYSGPAAILMMAAGPWTKLANPIIVHERGADRLFRPAMCLYNREATLLSGEVSQELRDEWVDEQGNAQRAPRVAPIEQSETDHVVRAIHADLLGEGAYAVKNSVFNWNDWAMALFNSPVGVLKQLKMLSEYRKKRVPLNETQARIVIALLDQPDHMATSEMLEAALGARYGLTASKIESALVAISGLRSSDGTPADIVVRDGEKWRAVDL